MCFSPGSSEIPEAEEPGKAVWAGSGLLLSQENARRLMETTADRRRALGMSVGSLALNDWREFAKRFGYLLLWGFAELRLASLIQAVSRIRYRLPDGQPCLYAVALYDHHEYRFFAQGLSDMAELTETDAVAEAPPSHKPVRRWCQHDLGPDGRQSVAQVTLTPVQLIVECDSPERLDALKHRLAAEFGFALRFRGETLTPPAHHLSPDDLALESPPPVVVVPEEDQRLIRTFLETAYLEWPDQGHPALGGQTPRRAAAAAETRDRVAYLIDQMERDDPGLHRTGLRAFDYNVLRAHVGLEPH